MESVKEMCFFEEDAVNYDVCLQSIKQIIRKILKCFICGEECRPKFVQTTEGELVCGYCIRIHGPSLGCELSCMYKHQGCHFKGKGATLEEHQKVCEYVSTLCIIKPCPWRGRQSELFDHFQTDHSKLIKIYGPNDKEICITFGKGGTVYAHMIKTFGKVFGVFLMKCPGMFHYVATNLEPFDATKYLWIIHFEFENGEKRTIHLDATQSYNQNALFARSLHILPLNDLPLDMMDQDYRINIMKKPLAQ
ncbi:hypothetical protein WA026_018361 [Henosepilachna vigintioctopunctata]|uniref:SIAH-type domain-containing protein n=1 Tax=Henosepilachna vigintioctopunctata TaxID=420089 RepID=A0AAW1V9W6_9CUCU